MPEASKNGRLEFQRESRETHSKSSMKIKETYVFLYQQEEWAVGIKSRNHTGGQTIDVSEEAFKEIDKKIRELVELIDKEVKIRDDSTTPPLQ